MAEWLIATVLKTVEGNTSVGSNPTLSSIYAGVVKLEYTGDLKSPGRNIMWVRLPPPVPLWVYSTTDST